MGATCGCACIVFTPPGSPISEVCEQALICVTISAIPSLAASSNHGPSGMTGTCSRGFGTQCRGRGTAPRRARSEIRSRGFERRSLAFPQLLWVALWISCMRKPGDLGGVDQRSQHCGSELASEEGITSATFLWPGVLPSQASLLPQIF